MKEVKMLCQTRFVVDATENSKGGVAAKVCSSQTGLWFCTLLRDIYARIRTYYVPPNIFDEKRTTRWLGLGIDRTCVQNFGVFSLKNGMDIWTFVRETCVFYVVACNYLVLVKDRVFALWST